MTQEAIQNKEEYAKRRDEILVLPPHTTYRPAFQGAGPEDELWDQLYTRAYRRLFRRGKARGLPYSQQAAIMADVILWRMIPESHRPEGWPRQERAIAHHHGVSVTMVALMLRQSRYELWAKVSPFTNEDRVRQVDQKVYDKAIRELEADGAKVEATRLFYQRNGLLESGKNRSLTVNVGSQTTVNVNLKPEDAKKELAEMLRYARLSELEGTDGLQGIAEAVVVEPDRESGRAGEVPPVEGRSEGPGELGSE